MLSLGVYWTHNAVQERIFNPKGRLAAMCLKVGGNEEYQQSKTRKFRQQNIGTALEHGQETFVDMAATGVNRANWTNCQRRMKSTQT